MLRYGGFGLLLLTCLPQGAAAQPAAQPALDTQQALGQKLFHQSCGVCHTKPQITAQQFGPVLSKDTAGGNVDAMRVIISEGTPRMPGFKYQFDSTQIAAIVAYLKTVPPQPAAPAGAPR